MRILGRITVLFLLNVALALSAGPKEAHAAGCNSCYVDDCGSGTVHAFWSEPCQGDAGGWVGLKTNTHISTLAGTCNPANNHYNCILE